ncbi:MAG: hypothetical protein HY801_08070 [Candidatus Lindowbacteria bacterium]|nr:hypothetical protein [Candidatus Lindowbacteria bacterium]
MNTLMKCLKTLGIVFGILFSWIAMSSISLKHSLFYFMLLSLIVLPVCYWRQYAFMRVALAALLFATMLTLSPIDFGIQATGQFGLHVLPTSFGYAAKLGTYAYGCIVTEYPARYAIVLSF